ncbi:hypothetical protein AUR67_05045 [Pseudoalteromonas sp. XI10]|nr:hypothetical protein AUR67_05045 [Pseudoalteromonas sp. XI10]
MLFTFLVISFLGFIYFKLFARKRSGLAIWLFYISAVIFGVFSMNAFMESEEMFYLGIFSFFIFVITIYLMSVRIKNK